MGIYMSSELMRIHKRRLNPLKRTLESVIVRVTKKNCWYDPWNRKGVRADYSILQEPVDAFIREADVEDILPMIELLLEKAKRQIEHSNDEGDCAGQARYWAQKLVKAAVKKNSDHVALIDWAIAIAPMDIYFLTEAETIVLEKNKVASTEVWCEIAEHYKDSNRRVYLLALKKAGKTEERRHAIRTTATLKKDYSCLVEDALSVGARTKANEVCERGLADPKLDRAKVMELKAVQAYLEAAEGRYDRELDLRRQIFEREQSIENYESLMELAVAMDRATQTRLEAVNMLEKSKKWYVLSMISLSEHRLKDAADYYWRLHGVSSGVRCGYEPYAFDFDLSDRMSRVHPDEAVKILSYVIDECLAGYMPNYEDIRRALIALKPILYVLGRAAEWPIMLESLRSRHPRKRTLAEIIDEVS